MANRSHFHCRRCRGASGFSLVELLVVIGILVVLAAILTPMVIKARKQGARIRQASDLQAIAAGLEEYKNVFGDYPRPGAPGTGFAMLGQALLGPGPAALAQNSDNLPKSYANRVYQPGEFCTQGTTVYLAIARTSSSTTADAPVAPASGPSDCWVQCPPSVYFDGADGPGFRVRGTTGQTYQFIQADHFKVRGDAILDIWGNAILYFPARAGSVNINSPQSYAWDSRDKTVIPQGAKPLYDLQDNVCMLGGQLTATNPPTNYPTMVGALQLLGDKKDLNGNNTPDGQIGPGETAATTGHYILWSAGADAEGVPNVTYGLGPDGKTDDVTNFDIDGSLLKK